jgi:hypothetical protein
MRLRHAAILLAALLGIAGSCFGQIADLSGTWGLNVKKSSWSAMRKPEMVVLQIQHHEPELRLEGTVEHANEESRHFAFAGAVNGKDYPAQRSYGNGTVSIRRVNELTLTSTFRSSDGQYVEVTEIAASRDGHTLTQRIHLTTPSGKRAWTEVYERRAGN